MNDTQKKSFAHSFFYVRLSGKLDFHEQIHVGLDVGYLIPIKGEPTLNSISLLLNGNVSHEHELPYCNMNSDKNKLMIKKQVLIITECEGGRGLSFVWKSKIEGQVFGKFYDCDDHDDDDDDDVINI